MWLITNDREFRCRYEYLSILTKHLNDNDRLRDPEKIRSKIKDVKRELRHWAHRDTAVDVGRGFMVKRRIVKDNGVDGYVELVSIPEVFDTATDADEFFRGFLEIQRSSMYDCTGQAFTRWYKIFQRGGQFWAYHYVGIDV